MTCGDWSSINEQFTLYRLLRLRNFLFGKTVWNWIYMVAYCPLYAKKIMSKSSTSMFIYTLLFLKGISVSLTFNWNMSICAELISTRNLVVLIMLHFNVNEWQIKSITFHVDIMNVHVGKEICYFALYVHQFVILKTIVIFF